MLHTVLKGRDAGASFQLFLGGPIFFIFQCHRTIEKLEKTALHMCLFDIRTYKEIFFYFLGVGTAQYINNNYEALNNTIEMRSSNHFRGTLSIGYLSSVQESSAKY